MQLSHMRPLCTCAAVRVRAVAVAALACALFASAQARAQREFVEEVEPKRVNSLDNVDLDAPDPAAKKPPPAGSTAAKTPPPTDKPTTPPTAPTPTTPTTATTPPPPATPPAGSDEAALAAAAATAAQALAESEGGVKVLETSHDAFLEKWDGRAASVRRGEVAHAHKQLAEIDGALLDFGVQGIPGAFHATSFAQALLLEGKRALDDGNLEEAGALFDAAEHADADLVAVHTSQALLRWRGGDLGGTVNALFDAVRALLRDPLSSSQVSARAIAAVVALILLALVLFTILAGLPALRYLSFDLLQLLPRGAAGGQVLALVIMLAVAPLVVGAGPVFGALWILTLAFLYVQPRERVVVGVIALACVALPLIVAMGARFLSYPDSRAERAFRALYDADGEGARRDLAKMKPTELDVVESAALALAAKREGRIDDAVAGFTDLAAKHGDLAWVHADLGVAQSLAGNEDAALTELGKAVSTDPHTHAASFDISVLHYRKSRTDKAQAAVQPVARDAPDLLNAYRRTTFRAPDQTVAQNRALIDVYPSPHGLLRDYVHAASDADDAAVSDGVFRILLRGESGTRAIAFLGAFPLLWLVLFAARKKIAPSQPCVRCGDPASRRVDGKDVPEDTCSQCFHAFVSTRSRIDAGVKLRKEREIIRRRTRAGRTILALGVLLPGTGHIYGGAPVRGLVFTLLHGAALVSLALALGAWPGARLGGPWPDMVAVVAVGVVGGLHWIIAARSAWLLAQDASGRGRR